MAPLPLLIPEEWPEYTAAPAPANLATLIPVAETAIRSHCEWSISEETVAGQLLDSEGSRVLELPTLHLTAVAEILIDGEPVTDYEWSEAGMLYRRCGWPKGYRSVAASWTHGYNPAPADVKQLAVGFIRRLGRGRPGLAQETIGGWSGRFTEGADVPALSMWEKAALSHYRLS